MTALVFTLLFLWKNYCFVCEFDYFPTAAYGVICSVQIIIYLIHSSAESASDSVSVYDNNVASTSSKSTNNTSTEFWRGTKCALFNSLFAAYLYVTFTLAGMGIAALFVLFILVGFELHYYRPVFGRRTLLGDPNHITLHDSAFFAFYFIYVGQIVHWLVVLRHLSLASEQVIMLGFINDDILADAYAPLDFRSAPCLTERSSPSPSSSMIVMHMDTLSKGHLSTNLIILSLVGLSLHADIVIFFLPRSDTVKSALSFILLIISVAIFLFYSRRTFNIRTNVALWLFVWYSILSYILSLGGGDYGILLQYIPLISVLYLATNFEVVGEGPRHGD